MREWIPSPTGGSACENLLNLTISYSLHDTVNGKYMLEHTQTYKTLINYLVTYFKLNKSMESWVSRMQYIASKLTGNLQTFKASISWPIFCQPSHSYPLGSLGVWNTAMAMAISSGKNYEMKNKNMKWHAMWWTWEISVTEEDLKWCRKLKHEKNARLFSNINQVCP